MLVEKEMEGRKEDLGLSYLFLFPESGESSGFLLLRAAEKEPDDQYQRLVKEALDDLCSVMIKYIWTFAFCSTIKGCAAQMRLALGNEDHIEFF